MKLLLKENQIFSIAQADQKLPVGTQLLSFKSKLAAYGEIRLAECKKILGTEYTKAEPDLLNRFGSYELEEELSQKMQLLGISLPASGECLHLSPKRWREASSAGSFLWSCEDIYNYLAKQEAIISGIYLPQWVIHLQKRVKNIQNLDFYALTIAHIEDALYLEISKSADIVN